MLCTPFRIGGRNACHTKAPPPRLLAAKPPLKLNLRAGPSGLLQRRKAGRNRHGFTRMTPDFRKRAGLTRAVSIPITFRPLRFPRIYGMKAVVTLGALPPSPRHFSLWANSMVEEPDDDAIGAASPMPLNCLPPTTRARGWGRTTGGWTFSCV